MKIHRVVTMLGATTSTGKLASDMYDLNNKTYYSEAEQRDIPISHMDFQHLVRAFVKLCEQEDMLDRSEHMGRIKDLTAKLKQVESFNEHNDEVYKTNLKEQEDKLLELTTKVENLQAIINEKEDYIDHLREKVKGLEDTVQHWYRKYNGLEDSSKTKGHRYVFSEIPNDEYGKKLTRGMKVYLNNESYTMRVRGQHLKPELRGQGKASYGQSIEDSTHLRVYIDAI